MRIKKRVSLIILIIAVLALLGSAPLFASADSGGQKSCTVTLDLDGGSVNGLIAQGWTASDTGASVWTREEAAETEITLETPYRAGYEFKAWRTDPEGVVTPGENGEYRIDTSQSETVTVTAVWEEALYDVIFADAVSSDEASVWWEIRMPYGAVLWTEAEETWMDIADDAWKESEGNENEWTAEVLFEGNEKIEVTRHGQNTEANPGYEEYYYTFRRDGVFYFTYGGKEPVREGYTFLRWSASGGESEYQILSDVCFTAQYTAGKTYVFTTYYYNENGSRVEGLTTQTQTVKESEVTDGKVVLDIEVPRVSHYTGELRRSGYAERGVIISEDPVSDENGTEHYSVTVEIAKAFENEGSYHLAFYADYCPAQISYTVNYYQQKVGTGTDPGKDYDFVGAVSGTAAYESVVGIEDVPDRLIKNGAETDVSFEGFLVSSASQSSIRRGVELNNSVVDEADNTAEINIYYDRASYFIYPMTNSVEITLDPIKVQYGALIPRAEDAANISRAGYTLEGWDWYMLDESGALVEYSDVVMDQSTMPAHDLYPLANWKPETASLTIQYWVEDKNSSTYLNEFSYTVENIPTESNVTFSFTDHTLSAAGDPALTDQIKSAVEDGFKAHAGENEAQYFSYNEARTRQSLGNIQNAQESGTGDVSSAEPI